MFTAIMISRVLLRSTLLIKFFKKHPQLFTLKK